MIRPSRCRGSGILLHVTSLPGPYGIGDIGPQAMRWIDDLVRARQTWWQVLPLGPPDAGNSPYQSFSAFAGNPDLISPDGLLADGLIERRDLQRADFRAGQVQYDRVGQFKSRLLDQAWNRFQAGVNKSLRVALERFYAASADWINDFALFMALKEVHSNRPWTAWPRELVARKQSALRQASHELRDRIDRHRFVQFLFFRQWNAVRRHARARQVRIIGDLPMFVSADSADVWANPTQFLLDRSGQPTFVTGVPPDYFSRTGQRWGNPQYNWPAMRRDGFGWWVRRVRSALGQADVLRIDHFRGMDACWHIPASRRTARHGRWVRSPGRQLLSRFRDDLGGLPFIAEDLGLITPSVEKLRDEFALPGMRVLQFAFGGGSENPFLPHNYPRHTVAYTGTHDNDTSTGWYRSLPADEKARARQYAPDIDDDPASAMIRLAWSSVADTVIAPAQDLLGLGSEARMNVPGKATGNWSWRLAKPIDPDAMQRLAQVTETYGRCGTAPLEGSL